MKKQSDSLLRFITCGSVDDGKSTLIGRLLYDSKTILSDTYNQIEKTSQKRGLNAVDLSLLTDGLQAEREQGITIDVAYRYFFTPTRKYIIADTPGHEQYTRNMVTAASTAQAAIILIDARKGILTQTKRHTYLSKLLGIKQFFVAINKMDLIDYDEKKFNVIKDEYQKMFESIQVNKNSQFNTKFIPLSALNGDMVVERLNNINWYQGETLLEVLELAETQSLNSTLDFRFPIQYVCRPRDSESKDLHDFRSFMGRIDSGKIKKGDKVKCLPSNHQTIIKDILIGNESISEAIAPQSVSILLNDEIDISRGDMFVDIQNFPKISKEINATICWFSEEKLNPGRVYKIMHTSKIAKAKIATIFDKIDVNTLSSIASNEIITNDIARIKIKLAQAIMADCYFENRKTGSFIMIDDSTNHTVAAGMINEIL
ncbi:MAG: GTP-binding protein [Proteobacteria bacterium]|jgi:sulfate adenylyltransferase subunit 1|nr:GTP-binding protein [Pseudomonadota bacterium]MDA0941533.1 GTP-binding protein [Pseudomonadota bacterium]MDA1035127.1 GTP-binding protein [Pseudomonadota bacterium]